MASYNGGLTTDQIKAMQNYYGTKADGLWGPNSAAAAGNGTPLSAQQAWNKMQQSGAVIDPTQTSYYTGNSGKYQLGDNVGYDVAVANPAKNTGSGGGSGDIYNGGLTTDQIIAMQNYYGTKADGLWGPNSTSAAGGLGAQQAWEKYQQSIGNTSGGSTSSGGGTTSTGKGWYDNEGLFEEQIKALQRYYGTAEDGKWGANSIAAAGGATAQQAWEAYVHEMMGAQESNKDREDQGQSSGSGDLMGFEDFYEAMGGAEYEQKIQDAINASVQRAVDAYNAQKADTDQDASEMARQAYIAKLLGEKNMAQRLAASGYAGGMAESAMLESEANYQNKLAEIQRERQRALDEIQRAINNARLTGDMEMAEQMTAYMQNAQNYYNDYVARVQEQEWAEEQARREALEEAARQQQAQNEVNTTPDGGVMSPLVEDPSGGITPQTPSLSDVKRTISGALQTGNPDRAADMVMQTWRTGNDAQREDLFLLVTQVMEAASEEKKKALQNLLRSTGYVIEY